MKNQKEISTTAYILCMPNKGKKNSPASRDSCYMIFRVIY